MAHACFTASLFFTKVESVTTTLAPKAKEWYVFEPPEWLNQLQTCYMMSSHGGLITQRSMSIFATILKLGILVRSNAAECAKLRWTSPSFHVSSPAVTTGYPYLIHMAGAVMQRGGVHYVFWLYIQTPATTERTCLNKWTKNKWFRGIFSRSEALQTPAGASLLTNQTGWYSYSYLLMP